MLVIDDTSLWGVLLPITLDTTCLRSYDCKYFEERLLSLPFLGAEYFSEACRL